MRAAAKSVSAYLVSLSKDQRATLQKLRKTIKTIVPRAEECISYGVPAFRLDGRMLVWFAAAKAHCSFFPGAYPIKALRNELKTYSTSKGTVRFPVNTPLPATLVRKLVKARIAERAAKPG